MSKCACRGSFLERFIQPSVLIILTEENLHGFSIYKKLIESENLAYTSIDATGLYRTLKKMEESGLLTSEISATSETQKKKIYSITDSGRECLATWKITLTEYKQGIENLIEQIPENLPQGKYGESKQKALDGTFNCCQ